MMKKCRIKRFLFYPVIVFLLLQCIHAQARDKGDLTLFLTANIEGKFIPAISNQERDDPMVLLGQAVTMERRKRDLIYFDLGNAFYPGVLSKYSYGGAVMDFFRYFGCASTLVSSNDLKIGLSNLEFLQKEEGTSLLSSNITRDGKNIFKPYIIKNVKGKKIAFVGVSSKKILFDIAEKNIYRIALEQEKDAISRVLPEIKEKNVSSIVLLSGLGFRENLELLNSFKEIALIISGGDNKGVLLKNKILRTDMSDGRSIITLPSSMGYYLLNLKLGPEGGVVVESLSFNNLKYIKITDDKYREFLERLKRWKKHLLKEVDRVVAKTSGEALLLNNKKITALMRHRYNAEVAIIRGNAISPAIVKKDVSLLNILSSINDDYSIFSYELTGAELKTVLGAGDEFYFSGCIEGKIQGYEIDDMREYRIVSTQSSFEKTGRLVGRIIHGSNKWKNISDIIVSDIKKEKILYRDDYAYLDNRFRSTLDVYMSFFYENANVDKGSHIDTPPGEPEESYMKWGLESKIDLAVYNRYHYILFTPYINYQRKDDDFLNNLLRGTLLYNINLNYFLKPYLKSQVDTVVFRSSDNLRPVLIRDTIGADINTAYITGRLGVGFEKKVHDPVDSIVFGIEPIINFTIDFLSYFNYTMGINAFISFSDMSPDKRYIRSELNNSISFKITEMLGVTFKHKWYYYYSMNEEERYSNSQFITAADLKTDFKIW